MTDPDNINAEFGIIIRSELKGKGLGQLLMDKLIGYLRAQGTQRIVATVLRENHRMLELAHSLGFQDAALQEDGGTRSIVMALQTPS
jgi:acetyltransferase